METRYRNKNRGYQQLRVWQEAIDFYAACCRVFHAFPGDLRRVAAQAIASADSVHRNIAEGDCRKSIREYLHFLNFALGSLGESVSGLHACRHTEQISAPDFDALDALAFKLENGLLRLVASLQCKERDGTWDDTMVLNESNESTTTT